MAIRAAEAHDTETCIAEAADATEALAREIFGGGAYLRRGSHVNPETGEELPAFEVHYCFENWEDFERLESLHNQFLDAYLRIVGPGLRSRIALKPIPTDGD